MDINYEVLLLRIMDLEAQVQQIRAGDIGWKTTAKCMVFRSTDQSGIVHDTYPKILFNSVKYDPSGLWNSTNYRIVIKVPGYYYVSGRVSWTTAVVDKLYALYIIGNGEVLIHDRAHSSFASGISNVGSNVLHFNAGNYLELLVYHNQGSDATVMGDTLASRTFLTVHLLSRD